MTALAGRTFGLAGALAAFPRRIAARAVARAGGQLRRGVGRQTTDVVFGHTLLERAGAPAIAARATAERTAGRRLIGEGAFLRLLDATAASGPEPGDISRQALLDGSGLAAGDLDMLALFDAFEQPGPPFSFRDLILARKYAGLAANGATWDAIARSVHRFGPVASLTAKSLELDDRAAICLAGPEGLRELDGQLRLDLAPAIDEADALFEAAEAAETAGDDVAAARLYGRCLGADPADADAAFNRANCLRRLGRTADAVHDYHRALKLDAGFVEAWFNLAVVLGDGGRPAAARRALERAVALDPGYADAVFNLASLAFEAGDLPAARRGWETYLTLDPGSDWARTAARGLRYLALRDARDGTG